MDGLITICANEIANLLMDFACMCIICGQPNTLGMSTYGQL